MSAIFLFEKGAAKREQIFQIFKGLVALLNRMLAGFERLLWAF